MATEAKETKPEVIKSEVVKSEVTKTEVTKQEIKTPAANQETVKNNEIIIDLNEFSKIEILSTATGEKNKMIINTGKISLTRGQIYKLPIKNKSLSLDISYFAKVINDFRSHIQILNITEGTVSILPLVHNTIIKNGDIIGLMV